MEMLCLVPPIYSFLNQAGRHSHICLPSRLLVWPINLASQRQVYWWVHTYLIILDSLSFRFILKESDPENGDQLQEGKFDKSSHLIPQYMRGAVILEMWIQMKITFNINQKRQCKLPRCFLIFIITNCWGTSLIYYLYYFGAYDWWTKSMHTVD